MTNNETRDAEEKFSGLYRMLPSIHDLLLSPACRGLSEEFSRTAILSAARSSLALIRSEILTGRHTETSLGQRFLSLGDDMKRRLQAGVTHSLRPVINATGVILHTNLGRAPLSRTALDHLVNVAQGYCNLEMNLDTGARSRRDVHVESLVLRALMAQDQASLALETHGVLIVNNCAAATFLALNSLAEGKEVLISRGELIEIGGGFRIPEILEKSGAILKEVGTTNRTRLSDYEDALGPNTGLILRVHRSNFSMDGFVESPSLKELVSLGKRVNVSVFEDQGTGMLSSAEEFGIHGEGSLRESWEQGVDLVAASGDKLLGGPQAGILVGRKDLITRLRTNPLLRTIRVDKLTYAALEGTLTDHMSADRELNPVLRMLSIPPDEVMRRCQELAAQIQSLQLITDVVPVTSIVGGGTAPRAGLNSCAVLLRHVSMNATALVRTLRQLDPAIIGRVSEDAVLLDLRTVPPDCDRDLAAVLNTI